MQVVIELDEKIISKIDSLSANRIKYFQEAIQEKLIRDEKQSVGYDEKVRRTIESYKKFPQQTDEYEIWQDEQVWED